MKTELFVHDSNEYTIIIGKNKQDNFNIIDDAFDTDIWFHVDGEPSSHVILKNDAKMRDKPKQVNKRCAYLCKINSKSKTQKECAVIYTSISNVTKKEVVGQVAVCSYKSVNV